MPLVTFELKDRDGLARIGRLRTPHGDVTTPTLLPVVNPNKSTISAKELRRLGFEIVITNAYIIRRKPELAARAVEKGVHEVLDFDGPVMTDSGTFQMYVYGDVEVSNKEIVDFQRQIGSDIGTILDVFTRPDASRAEAQEDVGETVERGKEAASTPHSMGLALPVQGGVFPELRESCARAYRDLPAALHPIGGVVPLMEQQRYAELVEAIVASKRGLRHGRPVHLFGAGHPTMFPLAALLGCDLFDSAGYHKYARDGRMMMPWGTVHLSDLEELPCACPVCEATTPQELRKLPDEERAERIAVHNLSVAAGELRRIREAIRRGRLWEFVEERCRAHPALLEGLRAVARHSEWLERFDPLSRPAALLCTGQESLSRPAVLRARERLRERPRFEGVRSLAMLEPRGKPFSGSYGIVYEDARRRGMLLACNSIFGPVPLELDLTYPFSQSIEPAKEVAGEKDILVYTFAKAHGLDRVEPPKDLASAAPRALDLARVRAVCDYQLGKGAEDVLLKGDVRLLKARNGRIRNVLVDGEHVLSLRAEDGFFTLKPAGARRLHAGLPSPRLRVVVNDDAAPFVRDGKSVMARFVLDADPELRPYDECLVVGARDALLGHGLALLNREEMLDAEHGMCVRVRDGFPTA